MPGCGESHLLVDLWDRVLKGLEDHRAAVTLLSINYEKAFSRMLHRFCLEQLAKMGASQRMIDIVHSFLKKQKHVSKSRPHQVNSQTCGRRQPPREYTGELLVLRYDAAPGQKHGAANDQQIP